MRFGICTAIENCKKVADMGYDYLEASATALAAMSEEEFAAALAGVKESGILVEAVNILFPGTFSLFTTPEQEIKNHLELVFSRAQKLGVKSAVFGSGKCRNKPTHIPFAQAYSKIVKIIRITGEIAANYGIIIVVEPLNRTETNMINSVIEGCILACDADMQNVSLLADSYHMFKENEYMDNIRTAGVISHTHIALLEGRAFPTECDDMVKSFFAALNDIGYTGRMSIEGSAKDFEKDAPLALAVLKSLAG